MEKQSKKILVVTGETSGDHHGALVLQALKQIDPDVHACGVGGDELERAGMHLLYHSRQLAVLGTLEVLSKSYHIIKAYGSIKKEIRQSPPDLVLLIDYPEFNLRIAGLAGKNAVPVLYYVSPQLWAWRAGRAKKIARLVDKMAVIFPFEAQLYEKEGLDVEFVGHPILDQDRQLQQRPAALNDFGLKENQPTIGLLPGSRQIEIDKLLPSMLDAVELIRVKFPSAQAILPVAPGLDQRYVERMVSEAKVPVKVVANSFYQALNVCDLVLVASGTATLETAIMEKPMIIIYKVALFTYLVGKMLIRVPYIGLANIVAGRQVVPELIQHEVTPARIADEAVSLLTNSERMQTMKTQLGKVKKALGEKGASERVARIAYQMITDCK